MTNIVVNYQFEGKTISEIREFSPEDAIEATHGWLVAL
jgi:hypothetical protein